MAEMEAMLDQLRAAPLETVGFVESVRKQAEALGFRSGAQIHFKVGGNLTGLTVAPGAQEALFRIAQEVLANIGRHARASHVTVAIFGDPHFLRLTIVDDGQGFDPAQPARGMGLANMRSRAQDFDGRFEIASSPGGGTTVSAAVPVVRPSTTADYNRRMLQWGAWAAAFIAFGVWRHSATFVVCGLIYCLYAVRIALARSALRRPESVK